MRTSFLRNSTGLKVDRTAGARLEAVTVSDSAADGLVLRGDRGTTLIGITANNNGGNGVLVTGPPTDRPITAISASGNKLFGVALLGQNKAQVNGISTAGNTVGGLRISFSTEVGVRDFSSTDDAIGVYTHVGSGQLTMDRMKIVGSRRGLQIEKTTRGLVMSASTIERSSIAGVSIGGHEIQLNEVTVNDSGTGVRVERGAGDVVADRLALNGGQDGVVALSATKNVVLRNIAADGVDQRLDPHLQPRPAGHRAAGSAAAPPASTPAPRRRSTGPRSPRSTRGCGPGPGRSCTSTASTSRPSRPGSTRPPAARSSSPTPGSTRWRRCAGRCSWRASTSSACRRSTCSGAIGVPLILLALVLEQVQAVRQRGFRGPRRRVPPTLPAQV